MGSQSINLLPGTLLSFQELIDEDGLMEMRAVVKLHAKDLGFSIVNQTKIVTAASELGRNVLEHGLGGTVKAETVNADGRVGLRLIFADKGPGIENLDLALTDGYTTKSGMGLGLTGSKRLMDEFDLTSAPGTGTTIVVAKWK